MTTMELLLPGQTCPGCGHVSGPSEEPETLLPCSQCGRVGSELCCQHRCGECGNVECCEHGHEFEHRGGCWLCRGPE